MNSNGVAVLHCAETIKGGIATYLRELLPMQYCEFGHGRVVVVIPLSQAHELPIPYGVKVIFFDDSFGRTINALKLAHTVRREVQLSGPSIVHIHSTFAGAMVRPFLIGLPCGVVYCPHGWVFDRPLSRLQRAAAYLVERTNLLLTDVVICISEHERHVAVAHGLSPKKMHVVLNGIGVRPVPARLTSDPWPDSKIRVLYVGRFDKQKGVDIMLAAMADLFDEAHAVLVGESVLEKASLQYLPKNVTRVGWVGQHEIEAYLDLADVLVVPSRWEGFGLIAVEAMRAGTAVIASRTGGLQEVVDDGITGFLINANSPSAIVSVVRSHDSEALNRMGEAGRRRFEKKFTIGRVHEELLAIYAVSSRTWPLNNKGKNYLDI